MFGNGNVIKMYSYVHSTKCTRTFSRTRENVLVLRF